MKKLLKNKKLIFILLGIVIVLVLSVFIYSKFMKKSDEIPFDDLIELVEKNQGDLTWSDFKKYKSSTAQDGLIYVVYDVEGDYILTISGKSLDKAPWAFKLENTKTKQFIDIISEDIIAFLGDDY